MTADFFDGEIDIYMQKAFEVTNREYFFINSMTIILNIIVNSN